MSGRGVAVGLLLALAAPSWAAAAPEGIRKIQHVVMIMQENRSLDTYFGTYPGANGIPSGVCVPKQKGGCVAPFYDPEDENAGGPHGTESQQADIDGGRMDGFVLQAQREGRLQLHAAAAAIARGSPYAGPT